MKREHEVTFTIPVFQMENEKDIFHKNDLSFSARRVKTKIKTGFKQNKFHFDIKVKMTINIVERLFPRGQDEKRRVNQED